MKRFNRHHVTWSYVGQSKQHSLTYDKALNPDDAAEEVKRNEDAADGLAEYAAACQSGTVRVLAHNIEKVT